MGPIDNKTVAFVLLSSVGILVSCSDDTGKFFPKTENLTFTAVWEGYEGAVSANGLVEPKSVAVESAPIEFEGALPDWSKTSSAVYTIDAGGEAASSEPIRWERDDEIRSVRAWYCGDGSTEAGGTNAGTIPLSWYVRKDQSAGGNGYACSSFRYAVGEVKAGGQNTLIFFPQVARVVVRIGKSEGLSDDSQLREVRLGQENLSVAGSFTPPSGNVYGTWVPGVADVTIIPAKMSIPPAGCVASYKALLVPQNLADKPFVSVTLESGDVLCHTPAEGDVGAVLECGREYVYTVTVDSGRKELKVDVAISDSWTENGEETITSYQYIEYAPDDPTPKVGDYFYADGTWSDGGLRRAYFDGRMEWAGEKPAPLTSGKVIGIVFSTDLSRMGVAEKEYLRAMGAEPHGLVISTKNMTGKAWYVKNGGCSRNETAIGIPNIYSDDDASDTYRLADADIDGFYYNRQIRTHTDRKADYEAGCYPVFSAAEEFAAEAGGPSEQTATTGWYLPSHGQWFDILRNLGGAPLNPEPPFFIPSSNTQFLWNYSDNSVNVNTRLNDIVMERIAREDKTDFSSGMYWVGSAMSDTEARALLLLGATVNCINLSKDVTIPEARYVLAF